MVKKLVSLLTNRIAWRLTFEAVLFGLLLRWIAFEGPYGLAGLLYFLFFFYIYIKEQPERKRTRILFWFFGLLSVFGVRELMFRFPENSWISLVILGLSVYFFFLIGVTSFFFKKREFAYPLLNTFVLFLVSAWAFGVGGGETYLAPAFFLLSGVTLLIRDALGFFDAGGRRRAWVLSSLLGALAVEISFFLRFLPLGFLNAAAFLTLALFLSRDALLAHFRGRMDLPLLFRELTFFVGLSIVIFAGSSWVI